jgi:putative tricarboxylic transport membrane protein
MTLERELVPEADIGSPQNNRLGLVLQRVVAAVLVAMGVFVTIQSVALSYYTPVGPGPGFFPFWLGLLLVVLAGASLVTTFVSKIPVIFEDAIIPDRAAGIQMAINFVMVGFFALTVRPAGFVFSMFVVLIVLLLVNRVHLLTALAVALGASLGASYAFANWLHVYLPPAPFGILAAIGL